MDDPKRAEPAPPFRLRSLSCGVRLALTLLILALLGGYAVAGAYLANHYDGRDTREGLTIDDIKAAYHGISAPAPLTEALSTGHPEELGVTLDPAKREAMLDWLEGGGESNAFDDFDLGDMAPAEIIATDCLTCHSRSEAQSRNTVPLEYWDEVSRLAVSMQVEPTPPNRVMQSIHAHAPSMAVILIVLTLLAGLSRFGGALAGLVATVAALGLIADFAGQWLAKDNATLAWLIVGGGFAYGAGAFLLALMAVAEMWLPGRRN